MSLVDELTKQLRRDEGEVLHAYEDHIGFLTIGVGRLIDKRRGGGISAEESAYLLSNDIARVSRELQQRLPWIDNLDEARKGVLLNMAFQMGVNGLAWVHEHLEAH
jgi:lysozyme